MLTRLKALIWVDPPYNVKINGHANAKGRHREFAMASGEMKDSEFRAFLRDTLGACAKVSRDGAVHFVCIDWRHMDDVAASSDGVYSNLLNICVWNKSNAGMGSLYRSKHEMVFVYRVGELEMLGMVTNKFKTDGYRVRCEIDPWIVEKALERLGWIGLCEAEQRVVWEATRTPHKVKWPSWWTYKPGHDS